MASNSYICTACNKTYAKWAGQCSNPDCKKWNTIEENKNATVVTSTSSFGAKGKGVRAAEAASGSAPRAVTTILTDKKRRVLKTSTGVSEFDRVLGGGLTEGGVIFLAGSPGAGKSTLVTHVAAEYAAAGKKVLYVTGEETEDQVADRVARVQSVNENLFLLAESHLQNSIGQAHMLEPDLVIVDSVQTQMSEGSEGRVGSITQVTEVATGWTSYAKKSGTPLLIIGHVTKEGSIAGPRVVEHLVDVVLQFEANSDSPLRLLRALKNRFGSTEEIGCFQHTETGLESVTDPSGFFTDEHEHGTTGYATSLTLEGQRALPFEVQALVTPTRLPNPRKITEGMKHSRSQMLQAVADRYVKGMRLFDQDVYVATTGGLRLDDSGTDLAAVAALISSRHDKALPENAMFLGEVSLTGEIRQPMHRARRVTEARRLGFDKIYAPPKDKDGKSEPGIIAVRNVRELAAALGIDE